MTTTDLPQTDTTADDRVATARDLADRWDAQQTGFIRHRAERFATIARVVAGVLAAPGEGSTRPEHPRVLDLAGGCGSLGRAVLAAVPDAEVVVADKDPLLVAIAADLALAEPLRVVELDLDDPAWTRHPVVAERPFDAVVSSTALHWLRPEVLVRVLGELAGLVRPGGVVLNGDHLLYDERSEPTMRALAAADDEAVQAAAFGSGVDTWEAWWAAAEAVPHLAAAAERRRTTWGRELHEAPAKVSLELHLAALRSAGFAETGTVWRYLDDHVLYAVR